MASPEVSAPVTRRPARSGARPVLVTGLPRSGTTWLARELATARRAALAGREPMNPRQRQFALAGTVAGWVRLDRPTARQERVLRRAYRGLEPRVYSRYGTHQWLAPLPWTHTIVKDPFALLSVPTVVEVTGAVPLVVYRPCGAVLASYRRMGWTADVAELRSVLGEADRPMPVDDVAAMIEFWTGMHRAVVDWLPTVPDALLVSHAELTRGGRAAMERLMRSCGLTPSGRAASSAAAPALPPPGQLHDFDRAPEEVAEGWRARLEPTEVNRVEEATQDLLATLDDLRLRVS